MTIIVELLVILIALKLEVHVMTIIMELLVI